MLAKEIEDKQKALRERLYNDETLHSKCEEYEQAADDVRIVLRMPVSFLIFA